MPRIERLDLASVHLPDWHPEAGQGTAVVYGYVVDHPDGAIVVDTGVGFGNEFIDELYAPDRQRLDDALLEVGVDPVGVIAVVNSHLHFDHCGQNPLFHGRDVPIYVQAPEVAEVEGDAFYTDASWVLGPDDQRRVLDGDHPIVDGVTIIATPGHTPGHQSVLVEGGGHRAVLAGQPVWHLEEFVDDRITVSNVFSDDLRPEALDSIRRIKSLRPDVVHFAHCSAHHGPGD